MIVVVVAIVNSGNRSCSSVQTLIDSRAIGSGNISGFSFNGKLWLQEQSTVNYLFQVALKAHLQKSP